MLNKCFSTERKLIVILLFFVSALYSNLGSATEAKMANLSSETATIDLQTLLRLKAKISELEEKIEMKQSSITFLEKAIYQGRFSGRNIELKGSYRVMVRGEHFLPVKLLKMSNRIAVIKTADSLKGSLKIKDGFLTFVPTEVGAVDISVDYLFFGGVGESKGIISGGNAAHSMLTLEFDNSLYKVRSQRSQDMPDGIRVLDNSGQIDWAWEVRQPEKMSRKEVSIAKKVDPVIEKIDATMVVTQDGKSILHMLMDLKISDARELTINLPEGEEIESIRVNDIPIVFVQTTNVVTISVSPRTIGRESAAVEVMFKGSGVPFLLSGHRSLLLPKLSLLTNTLNFKLFLPDTFEYKVQGGSLAKQESNEKLSSSVNFPTPGKEQTFLQYLISESRPHLELIYTVDLKDQYFTDRQSL